MKHDSIFSKEDQVIREGTKRGLFLAARAISEMRLPNDASPFMPKYIYARHTLTTAIHKILEIRDNT